MYLYTYIVVLSLVYSNVFVMYSSCVLFICLHVHGYVLVGLLDALLVARQRSKEGGLNIGRHEGLSM